MAPNPQVLVGQLRAEQFTENKLKLLREQGPSVPGWTVRDACVIVRA